MKTIQNKKAAWILRQYSTQNKKHPPQAVVYSWEFERPQSSKLRGVWNRLATLLHTSMCSGDSMWSLDLFLTAVHKLMTHSNLQSLSCIHVQSHKVPDTWQVFEFVHFLPGGGHKPGQSDGTLWISDQISLRFVSTGFFHLCLLYYEKRDVSFSPDRNWTSKWTIGTGTISWFVLCHAHPKNKVCMSLGLVSHAFPTNYISKGEGN